MRTVNQGRGPQPGPYYPERDEQILRLRDEGLRYRQIGEQFGLSRERIRQIVKRGRKLAGG